MVCYKSSYSELLDLHVGCQEASSILNPPLVALSRAVWTHPSSLCALLPMTCLGLDPHPPATMLGLGVDKHTCTERERLRGDFENEGCALER